MTKDKACHKPFFKKFMQRLKLQRGLGLHDPPVWLWISKNAEQAAFAIAYAQSEMTGYALKTSSYRMAKNERLYDCKRVVEEVHLLFLIKKDSNVNSKRMKEYYIAPTFNTTRSLGSIKRWTIESTRWSFR